MMLKALYDLAEREGLLADPDYEMKRVDFLVRVANSGRFVALVPTVDDEGRASEKRVPKTKKRSGTAATPQFLFDNAKYVFGINDGRMDARSGECAAAFRKWVAEAAEETGDEGLNAVARFLAKLSDGMKSIFAERPQKEWTGSEWIAFVRDEDGAKLVHDRPRVQKYWKACRARADANGERQRVRCLVTGALDHATQLHDSVKHLSTYGAQTSGASLVSFNADAFVSHSLSQGDNAPIGRAAAEGYVTALNWLLQGSGGRRHRYGVALGSEAVTVFWTREAVAGVEALVDLLDPAVQQADADTAVRAANAPWRGFPPGSADSVPFYALTLSANAARVVVRDWFESTWGEVRHNLDRYFEDLRVGRDDRPLPLRRLLEAAASPSGAGLRPDLDARVFRAALRGSPFPRELLAASLRRLRLPPNRKGVQFEPALLHMRCALVKAVLRRLPHCSFSTEVTVSLDETNRSVPYLLGRLFAVLERLQATALKDLNASIRDRYFGAASTTPSTVFPRLLRLAVHHASKADNAHWLEKLQGEIVAAMPPRPFPATLALERIPLRRRVTGRT